jgi:hypothetical protein
MSEEMKLRNFNAVLRVCLGPESDLLIIGVGTGAEILDLAKPTAVGIFWA